MTVTIPWDVRGGNSVAFLGYSVVSATCDKARRPAGSGEEWATSFKLPAGFVPISVLPAIGVSATEISTASVPYVGTKPMNPATAQSIPESSFTGYKAVTTSGVTKYYVWDASLDTPAAVEFTNYEMKTVSTVSVTLADGAQKATVMVIGK